VSSVCKSTDRQRGVKSYVTIAPLLPRASIHGYLQFSGRGRSANHPPPPQYLLTRHTIQLQGNLPTPLTHNNTKQNYTTAFGYIKLPMYLLFLWRLYLMVLRAATSLLGASPSNAPRNDIARLKTIMYRAIKTTGTLIVKRSPEKLTPFNST
jgi:hypothetical protein